MFIIPVYYIFIHNRIPFIKFKGWDKERKHLVLTNFYLLAFYLILALIMSIPSFDFCMDFKKLAIIIYSGAFNLCFYSNLVFYMQHQHNPNYKAWKQDWQFFCSD
jgi:omega-6 fatty acid desaturase (delta-12 desaturase)